MLRPLREPLPPLIGAKRRQQRSITRHCYQVFVSKNPLGAPFVEKSRGALETAGSALCQDVVQRSRAAVRQLIDRGWLSAPEAAPSMVLARTPIPALPAGGANRVLSMRYWPSGDAKGLLP